jgi:hypothetical protein
VIASSSDPFVICVKDFADIKPATPVVVLHRYVNYRFRAIDLVGMPHWGIPAASSFYSLATETLFSRQSPPADSLQAA